MLIWKVRIVLIVILTLALIGQVLRRQTNRKGHSFVFCHSSEHLGQALAEGAQRAEARLEYGQGVLVADARSLQLAPHIPRAVRRASWPLENLFEFGSTRKKYITHNNTIQNFARFKLLNNSPRRKYIFYCTQGTLTCIIIFTSAFVSAASAEK